MAEPQRHPDLQGVSCAPPAVTCMPYSAVLHRKPKGLPRLDCIAPCAPKQRRRRHSLHCNTRCLNTAAGLQDKNGHEVKLGEGGFGVVLQVRRRRAYSLPLLEVGAVWLSSPGDSLNQGLAPLLLLLH